MSKTDISNNYVKPYDIGNTIISASVSENEKIVTLNTEHKKHGYIKLAPIMSFSNTNWYNPEAVRRYRNSFLLKETAEEGYGIEFEFEKNSCKKIHTPIQFHDSSNVLSSKKTYNNIEFKKYFFIPPNKNSISQIYEIKNLSNNQINSNFKISGKYGIMRASYGQITENGPIEIPTINNILSKVSTNFIQRLLPYGNMCVHGTFCIRKKMLMNLNGYNEYFKYSQDYDLLLRFIQNKCNIIYEKEILYELRLNDNSISQINSKSQYSYSLLASYNYFYKKSYKINDLLLMKKAFMKYKFRFLAILMFNFLKTKSLKNIRMTLGL